MSGPILTVLIIYILGLLTGYFGFLPPPVLGIVGLLVIIFGILSLFQGRENSKVYIYLLAFLLGVVNIQWHITAGKGNVEALAGKPVVITGTICQEPEIRPEYINYVIKIEKAAVLEEMSGEIPEKPRGKILLTISGKGAFYAYGDRLEVNATPLIPAEPGQPGDFNYRKYLQLQGIQLIAKARQGAGVSELGTGDINIFVNACLELKARLLSVTQATLAPRHAGLLQGLLFGSDGLIDNQIKTDFAYAGVVHILSVSGFHVTLIAAICLFFIDGLRLNRRVGLLLTVTITLAYTVMSGAGPAAVRSLIMGWTMLAARYLKRDYNWVTSLCLSALILLLIDPNYLLQAGFQLSFAATWGILCLTPQICKLGRLIFAPAEKNNVAGIPQIPASYIRQPGLLRLLGSSIGLTLSAQLAVFPISSYYFYYFSLAALPANLIIVPLTTLVMILGGLASIVGLIWLPLASVINVSTGFITEFILMTTHWLAQLPMAVITVRQPAVYEIAVFYLILFSGLYVLQTPAVSLRIKRIYFTRYPRLIPVILTLVACLLWINVLFPEGKELELTFLDIGQGDAAVLESPGGLTAVIDTGGANELSKSSYNPGEKILMPFLRRKGIRKIDLLLLSHPHADHIQGAEFLVDHIPVKMLIISGQFCADKQGAQLVDAFKAKGTKIREVSGGDMISFDEKINLEVISPPEAVIEDTNDASLVFRLGYGEFQALFTGDAGAEVLEKIDKSKLSAEVVKVPHHGSKFSWSESFYQAVDPEAAVISVGSGNNFGHPARQVLQGLRKLGTLYYRTDINGAVIINSDGRDFKIRAGRTAPNVIN